MRALELVEGLGCGEGAGRLAAASHLPAACGSGSTQALGPSVNVMATSCRDAGGGEGEGKNSSSSSSSMSGSRGGGHLSPGPPWHGSPAAALVHWRLRLALFGQLLEGDAPHAALDFARRHLASGEARPARELRASIMAALRHSGEQGPALGLLQGHSPQLQERPHCGAVRIPAVASSSDFDGMDVDIAADQALITDGAVGPLSHGKSTATSSSRGRLPTERHTHSVYVPAAAALSSQLMELGSSADDDASDYNPIGDVADAVIRHDQPVRSVVEVPVSPISLRSTKRRAVAVAVAVGSATTRAAGAAVTHPLAGVFAGASERCSSWSLCMEQGAEPHAAAGVAAAAACGSDAAAAPAPWNPHGPRYDLLLQVRVDGGCVPVFKARVAHDHRPADLQVAPAPGVIQCPWGDPMPGMRLNVHCQNMHVVL